MAVHYEFSVTSLFFLTAISFVYGQLSISFPNTLCANEASTQNAPYYFDVLRMRCTPCSNPTSVRVDDSGLNCVCKPGYFTKSYFGGDAVDCEACPLGEVTSADGFQCLTCPTTLRNDGTCPVCTNPDTSISVEKDLNGEYFQENGKNVAKCVTCTGKNIPNADRTMCERCSTVIDTAPSYATCNCSDLRLTISGGYCFDRLEIPTDTATTITLPNGESKESQYLVDNLNAIYILCKSKRNSTSCSQLAMACVADMNQVGDLCRFYRTDPISNQIVSLNDWPLNLPWLYYSEPADTIINRKDIRKTFSLKKDSIDNNIQMFVAMYTLEGKYLGVRSVDNGVIQLCPDTREKLDAAWSFGSAYEQTCVLNAAELMAREELFFDPYLKYEDNLYPLPVLVTNYKFDSPVENGGSDTANWQFTRRFFLVENTLLPGSEYPSDQLVYVENMELHFELIPNDEGKIYTPYLTIAYGTVSEAEVAEKGGNLTVSSKFTVTYELNSKKFDDDFKIALGVLGGLAFLYGCVQTWSWARRSGNVSFPVIIMKFMAFMTGTLSNGFLIVLVSISIWWLITFKRQDKVYLLPITAAQETFFKNILIVAFSLKLLDMFHLFVQQVPVDIFLIDWERPKTVTKDVHSANQDNDKPAEATVSIWRTYFVANEWNEIQTTRKISGLFQLIVTILFLNVIGFENLCTKDRESNFMPSDDDYIAPHSKMFRFGIMSAIWLVIALTQWLFFTLLWERFVEDKVRQFVDLCSMANISVFVMENNLYGYYIHGRSPHGIADTGMKQMFRQLKRETENLCAHRGLVPNTDAQTFRMALPLPLRAKYDEVFRTLNQRRIMIKQRHLAVAFDEYTKYNPDAANIGQTFWQRQRTQPPSGRNQGGEISDRQFLDINANATINKFFSDFLDHSLRDIDYIVKDKILFESLLDAEFDPVIDKGIFYNDNGHAFDQVLFYGNELTLTTFEVLLFGLVDMTSSSGFLLSAVVVYFVSLFFQLLRDGLGRRNLAQKTLVDERFLI